VGHRARQFFFVLAGAHLRRSDAEVAVEDMREVAVAGVSELQGELGQVGIMLTQPLERDLDPKRVTIVRERLSGGGAKRTAELPRRAVHRSA